MNDVDAGPAEVAFETSRREASLAIALGEHLLEDELGERAHASDLIPRLERLLARAGVARLAGRLPLRAVYVGLGPGSYTGLRVGIATAQALARASEARLFGLSSFEALAFAELASGQEGAVVLDARAGRFYHARYRRTPAGLEVLEEPRALEASELRERCRLPGPVLAHPGLAEAAGLSPHPNGLATGARPLARAVLELGRARALGGSLAPARALEPLYLRAFGDR